MVTIVAPPRGKPVEASIIFQQRDSRLFFTTTVIKRSLIWVKLSGVLRLKYFKDSLRELDSVGGKIEIPVIFWVAYENRTLCFFSRFTSIVDRFFFSEES